MSKLEFADPAQGRWLERIERHKRENPIVPTPSLLPGGLIVSMTTYKERFSVAHLTIKSIIEQTVRANKIVIWIAANEFPYITREMLKYSDLVEFLPCDDIRSYKKLVYTVSRYPNHYVVTADDDTYYHRFWLQTLIEQVKPGESEILCHVAYRTHLFDSQRVAPYNEWTRDVQDSYSRVPSFDLVPIGVGGILYPPRSLHTDLCNRRIFEKVAPYGDDLWFYVMSRLAGTPCRKVGSRLFQIMWPGSQDTALWQENLKTRNDEAISKLVEHYGIGIFSL